MAPEFTLPATIVGPGELARLHRDLEAFEDELQQGRLRAKTANKAVTTTVAPGHQLVALAEANGIDLQLAEQRKALAQNLEQLLKTAPTITMSFAADPSTAFMTKITAWFRETIDPHVLVRTGLQPNIAAGFMLRTPSKVYDFSLRSKFAEQRPELLKRLRAPKATVEAAK